MLFFHFRSAAIVALCSLLLACGKAERYFPSGTWPAPGGGWTEESSSEFYEDWFGKQLFAMREKPMMEYGVSNSDQLIVRLLFLPTFDNGAMIRLSLNSGEENSFVFKKLSGMGGYKPGVLSYRSSGIVDNEYAETITSLIEAISPWGNDTPTIVRNPEFVCTDGTQTVLEFRTTDSYKVVSRHECELTADDNIRRLIQALDDLSEGKLVAPDSFLAPKRR